MVLSEHLSNLLHSFSLPQEEESSAYTEDLDDSIPELSSNLIHSTILGYGIPSNAMHTADKLEILRSLEAQGVFQTKGSVGQVARELHISEPTVYRYLRRIRSETV
nr:helix-turn-helix domain-containing protein [Brotocaccenecus cirricatena]